MQLKIKETPHTGKLTNTKTRVRKIQQPVPFNKEGEVIRCVKPDRVSDEEIIFLGCTNCTKKCTPKREIYFIQKSLSSNLKICKISPNA